jgi:hypothetical protein
MTDVVIFTGPSLSVTEAAGIAAFDYRLPAAQGDIYRAAFDGARVIGLIDGYFEGVPAVWHKEILFALAEGVHVFGAASMGALRAAELSTFGMRGIGQIYDWYAGGAIDADDEVALVHGPHETDFLALSEPLVNIRATIDKAIAAGVISVEEGSAMLGVARRIFYKQRNWDRVLAACGLAPSGVAALREWLAANRVDQKRLDARLMIETIAAFLAKDPGSFRAEFAFEPTDAWMIAVAEFRSRAELSEHDRLVLDEARLLPDRFKTLMRAAALVLLARREGASMDMRQNISRLFDEFRAEYGLMGVQAFREWQARMEMSDVELGRVLARREDAAAAVGELGDALLREIVNEIKLSELYHGLLERGARKARVLCDKGWSSPPLHFLVEWFFAQHLGRNVPADVDKLCREFALSDRRALQVLLAREFAFDSVER